MINPLNRPIRKSPVQIKIGLLMLLAIIILSGTGYLSYRNISSIVSSIHVDITPDLRVLNIREISMDLEKAENSIRLYTVTSDSMDLRPYFKVIWHINEKIKRLRDDCANDSLLLIQTDTIGRLIRQNIIIWSEILNLTNSDKMSQELKHLSDSLNIASANALKPEKGIYNNPVNRKYKSPINEVELISNLTRIEQQDRITKEKKIAREAQLATTGGQIREKFYDIITKMENEVTERINMKAYEADLLADETYRGIAMFALSGVFLAIVVMFTLVRYTRKTHAYQVALENSRNESEKLAKTKELFMANMSHEIRTPVTAISGFTEQLLHENHDEHTSRTLKIIKSSSDHLADIINDILDFSKLQNDKLVLEHVHFSIRRVLDDVYLLFEKQSIRNNTNLSYSLSPDAPHALLGDPYRLKQIMINLVSNAVKFTVNGKVHFSVKFPKNESGEIDLELEVIDTGIGIEESKIDSIFDDFTQAEMSTTRKYGGTGLGLSIVKKLVELHNGTIMCRSRKNAGTHITCRLPYQTGDEKQIKGDVIPMLYIPEEIRKLNILIVDDEEYNRLLFRTILNRWHVSNGEAGNGADAIEMIKKSKYNLLFMDARMPGLDGLKATQIIREELMIKAEDLPVICISAASLNDDWDKYEKAGMNAFLEKPFTEEMLMTTILNVIRDVTGTAISGTQGETKNNDDLNGRINLQNLFHIAGGDTQFTKQMLITFLETTTRGLEEMSEAAISARWNTVAELAHKLLPPARHIGATDLSNLLRKIEESIKTKSDIAVTESLTKDTIREFEVIRDLLNQQIAKIN
jgi:signal transduction histidine kinase/CheY-like chemotaxis protein/CHASE3 domain sensor protein/HPt (histidine-containing phosphotransfer) domain-containing protein